MYHLYKLYMSVEGRKDEKLAWDWLLQAASAGHCAAAEAAGLYCLNRDSDLARFWLSSVPKRASAKKALNGMAKEKPMTPDECRTRILTKMRPAAAAAK